MVNYATDLQYLFQSNDAKKPYNIDNLLFQLINESGFNNTVNITAYLQNVANVDIRREDADIVRKYIGIVAPGESPMSADEMIFQKPGNNGTVSCDTFCAGAGWGRTGKCVSGNQQGKGTIDCSVVAAAVEGSLQNVTCACKVAPVQTYDFTSDAVANDVYITITPGSTLSGEIYSKIISDVTTSNSSSDQVVKDHKQFRNYLFDIMEDIVKYNFDAAKQRLGSIVYALPESDTRQNVSDPILFLYNMKLTKLSALIAKLREACISSFVDMLKSSTVVSSETITDFRTGGFQSSQYYNLRNGMLKYLNVKNFYTNIDENQVIYFKKVAIDLFIKTCYPLVHMLYMQAMLNWYASQGDYVNVRVVVLAMTYYTFFTLKALYSLNVSIQPNQYQLNQTSMTNLNIIFNQLVTYVSNNNKINVDSNSTINDEMKNLVVGLHNLSRDVTNKNKDIQYLKNSIKENQLAMRNILFNISVKRKEFNKSQTEFVVALVVLIVFIVLNVVLLIMNQPSIVYISSGMVGIGTVALLIIMMVISFIKGGNK